VRQSWRRGFALAMFVLAALLGAAALFFGYYGARLILAAATFEGEGSLGHVGMYIAAVLFPFLALVAAGLAIIAARTGRRWRSIGQPPA
jgi:hypothetical protein